VAYTATQYALLSSFMAFGRTVLSSSGGWLADQMDWVSFFVLTTVAALPGLLLLVGMIKYFAVPANGQPEAIEKAENSAMLKAQKALVADSNTRRQGDD
jgi:hypothetical protein